MRIDLIIIDPQYDFCDPNGALYVKGADEDMKRLAAMVDRLGKKLDRIHITLDSHHQLHVAHPVYWKDSNGNHPSPFTIISANDVKNGTWTATRPSLTQQAINYVEQLEKNGKYPLCIWPPHCLIGHHGHNVYQPLLEAVDRWEMNRVSAVEYVTKGSNYHTEHYSAICADVIDPNDHTTGINTEFLNTVSTADVILLAGEAGSHCLASTGRDMVAYFNNQDFINKLVLLEDATSPVPGFENLQDSFVKDMVAKGMKVSKTTEYLK